MMFMEAMIDIQRCNATEPRTDDEENRNILNELIQEKVFGKHDARSLSKAHNILPFRE